MSEPVTLFEIADEMVRQTDSFKKILKATPRVIVHIYGKVTREIEIDNIKHGYFCGDVEFLIEKDCEFLITDFEYDDRKNEITIEVEVNDLE